MMRGVRSADRRGAASIGVFGTALVPLSRPHLFIGCPEKVSRCAEHVSVEVRPRSRRWVEHQPLGMLSTESATGIVGVLVPPLLHQCLELGIVPVR